MSDRSSPESEALTSASSEPDSSTSSSAREEATPQDPPRSERSGDREHGEGPSSPPASPESPSTMTWHESGHEYWTGELPVLSAHEGKEPHTLVMNLRGREGGVNPEMDDLASLRAAPGGSTRSYLVTSSAEDSPAKTCPSPADERGSEDLDRASSTSSPGSLSLFDPAGFSSRTYPDCSPHTAVGTSEQCLERWPTSGMAWPGGLSTAVTSECRSDEGGCSSSEPLLREILEEPQNVPEKYSLSATAAAGILHRAQRREKSIDEHLRRALESRVRSGRSPEDRSKTSTGREPT